MSDIVKTQEVRVVLPSQIYKQERLISDIIKMMLTIKVERVLVSYKYTSKDSYQVTNQPQRSLTYRS